MNQLSYWVHHMVVTTVCAKHQIGSASIFFTRLSQGLLSSNILASSWDGHIFPHFPPGVQPGDARTPFFGGWDSETWLVVSTVFFPGSSISCNKGCRSLVSKCFQGTSAGNRST